MAAKEAKARIKINDLLKDSGWRFFDDGNKDANIQVETNCKMSHKQIDDMGEDFVRLKMDLLTFCCLMIEII